MPLLVLVRGPHDYVHKEKSICWLNGASLYNWFITPVFLLSVTSIGFFVLIIVNVFGRPVLSATGFGIVRSQIAASLCCFVLMGKHS
jgi:hypothetical protein